MLSIFTGKNLASKAYITYFSHKTQFSQFQWMVPNVIYESKNISINISSFVQTPVGMTVLPHYDPSRMFTFSSSGITPCMLGCWRHGNGSPLCQRAPRRHFRLSALCETSCGMPQVLWISASQREITCVPGQTTFQGRWNVFEYVYLATPPPSRHHWFLVVIWLAPF